MRANQLSRRGFIVGSAAALVTAACSDSDASQSGAAEPELAVTGSTVSPQTTPTSASDGTASEAPPETTASGAADGGALAPLVPADFEALPVCVALPAIGAGPFPLDEQFDRRDVTEGYPGHPLRLGFRVVDGDCVPVPGAAVEIWHADASGDYSAFDDGGDGKDEGAGTTFLRGTQVADADGIVEFHTIYPGWYPGRAVHIHLRVRRAGELVLTSQVFFDDAYTEGIFAETAYAANGRPDTVNADDFLTRDVGSDGTLLQLAPASTQAGSGTLALANIGV